MVQKGWVRHAACQGVVRVTVGGLRGGLALASESGVTDAGYVARRAEWIDLAFIGGIHSDPETREAAERMIGRGRKEFMYGSAPEFVRRQFSRIPDGVVPGVNVRASRIDAALGVAEVVREYDGVFELNAHCRQPEMVAAGCGHALLRDADRLERWVGRLKETGVTVSVKTRAGVVDDGVVAGAVERGGGDVLHVDCMDSPQAVDRVAEAADLFVIANNGVRSRSDARDYLGRGADMVSVARGARRLDDLRRLGCRELTTS